MPLDLIRRFEDDAWEAATPGARTGAVEPALESGHVLWFPRLAFTLAEDERHLLDPRCADPQAKNISLRGTQAELRGAAGPAEDRERLRRMLMRYRDQAGALVDRLFPHYRGHLTLANTSFRPVAIAGRATSWRKDDTRLHVDAFPSNPSQGLRLLRVFNNLNPAGQPRVWRVGEPFEPFAQRHVDRIPRPLPGSAWLMERLHVTKRRRTEYDHLMPAAARPRESRPRLAAQRAAAACRVSARQHLGGLQRPGAACRDGRLVHDGADADAAHRRPARPRQLAAADPRADQGAQADGLRRVFSRRRRPRGPGSAARRRR